jgi:hypothetical protein
VAKLIPVLAFSCGENLHRYSRDKRRDQDISARHMSVSLDEYGVTLGKGAKSRYDLADAPLNFFVTANLHSVYYPLEIRVAAVFSP